MGSNPTLSAILASADDDSLLPLDTLAIHRDHSYRDESDDRHDILRSGRVVCAKAGARTANESKAAKTGWLTSAEAPRVDRS